MGRLDGGRSTGTEAEMTDGEKMVWAATFAKVGDEPSTEGECAHAIFTACGAVLRLRRITKILVDAKNLTPTHREMVDAMLGTQTERTGQ